MIAGYAFQPQARDQSGVVARPASQQMHRMDVRDHVRRRRTEQRRLDAADVFQRVGDCARLFEDFFLHVVAERSQLHRVVRSLDGDHLARYTRRIGIVDRIGIAPDVGDVSLLQIGHALRNRRERTRVGRKIVIVLSNADKQRAARASADDTARLARADCRDRVRTAELGYRLAHRRQQVAVVMRVDEVNDHLGVGLGDEPVALLLQSRTQGLEVFDDAVVHHRDLSVADVGMRVGARGRAVGRPAGV